MVDVRRSFDKRWCKSNGFVGQKLEYMFIMVEIEIADPLLCLSLEGNP